jgi:hypothetical protein
MRALATTLISAALMIAPWAASQSQAATEVQTWSNTTTIAPGQIGYVPANSAYGPYSVRNANALPPSTKAAQRTMQDLSGTKLPSNQPTDVAKAAATVKARSVD